MNFQEYKEKSITTRIYSEKVAIPYVLLGLQGEFGEFIEKINNEADKEDIKKELGDILWYIAGTYSELELNTPKDWPPFTNNTNGFTILYAVEKIGILCEQTKKYLRDVWKENFPNKFPKSKKEIMEIALWDLLCFLSDLCRDLFGPDVSLEMVAADNVEKLQKRKEKGLLHGSGDNREEE